MIYIEPGLVYDTNRPTALYDNIYLDGTLQGTADADFPIGNAVTGPTWDFWRTPSTSAASIEVLLADQTDANCLFIGAHDMNTVGADFRLRVSVDGGSNFTTVLDWTTPSDNSPIMVLFPRNTGNLWQLSQRNGPASIGVVMLGEKLAFCGGIDGSRVGFAHGNRVELMGGNSVGGQFLGQRVRRRGGNTSVTFPWLTSPFVDDTMAPFQVHYNDGRPFAFAGNPSYDDNDLAYCWRPDSGSELRPRYIQNGLGVEINMAMDYYVET